VLGPQIISNSPFFHTTLLQPCGFLLLCNLHEQHSFGLASLLGYVKFADLQLVATYAYLLLFELSHKPTAGSCWCQLPIAQGFSFICSSPVKFFTTKVSQDIKDTCLALYDMLAPCGFLVFLVDLHLNELGHCIHLSSCNSLGLVFFLGLLICNFSLGASSSLFNKARVLICTFVWSPRRSNR
jgi:hypothetical protein